MVAISVTVGLRNIIIMIMLFCSPNYDGDYCSHTEITIMKQGA